MHSRSWREQGRSRHFGINLLAYLYIWSGLTAEWLYSKGLWPRRWANLWRILLLCLLASATFGQAVIVCDDGLWRRVYNPQRLQVHQMCVAVTGTIVDATHGKRKDGVRKEADGDCHGWLKLDPGQEQYLNEGNASDEDNNLVYEVVCLFPVTQPDAKAACKDYKSNIHLAPVGSHVRISGSWVQDSNHARWNEIHPVTSIEVIP